MPPPDTPNIPRDLPPNPLHWNWEHVKEFLQANQEEYGLKDVDIGLIHKNNIHGCHFPDLTRGELMTSCKLTFGGAASVMKLIALVAKPQGIVPIVLAYFVYANGSAQ